MIKIKIGRKNYRGAYGWEDITLRQFTDLADIEMPPRYEAFIVSHSKVGDDVPTDELMQATEEITEDDFLVNFPEYYKQVISVLTNIPQKILNTAPVEEITNLYETYFRQFVLTLIYHLPVEIIAGTVRPYQLYDIRSFRLGLTKYYLPKTVYIMGQEIPLAKEPILTYAEAGDVFRNMKIKKGDVKRLALFTAIYCRRRKEKYKEEKAIKRSEKFLRVPMSVVWTVFFCIIRRLPDATAPGLLFGNLLKTIQETVWEVRARRNTDLGAWSMK